MILPQDFVELPPFIVVEFVVIDRLPSRQIVSQQETTERRRQIGDEHRQATSRGPDLFFTEAPFLQIVAFKLFERFAHRLIKAIGQLRPWTSMPAHSIPIARLRCRQIRLYRELHTQVSWRVR